jgi:hypothetical protein
MMLDKNYFYSNFLYLMCYSSMFFYYFQYSMENNFGLFLSLIAVFYVEIENYLMSIMLHFFIQGLNKKIVNYHIYFVKQLIVF